MNLRSDQIFVEDEGWHQVAERYEKFIQNHKNQKIVFLELGVGYNTPGNMTFRPPFQKWRTKLGNTPGIIKYPFWQMTNTFQHAFYVCLNQGEAYAPEEIRKKSVCMNEDIGEILKELQTCTEGEDLAKYGADCSGCMTVHTFETALHSKLEVPKRKKNQRNGECACLLGTDIGAYDTCGHLCKYCYANVNPVLVKENMRKHNPDSPFLIGGYMPGDIVREAIQKSWIDRQIRLEFQNKIT